MQGKVNSLRLEVSQRQKEYGEAQRTQLERNRILIRENTRLKDEVKMLRAEIGLKPVPDPIYENDSGDDFVGPAKSVRSVPVRPESSKAKSSFGTNRSIASSTKNLRAHGDHHTSTGTPSEK